MKEQLLAQLRQADKQLDEATAAVHTAEQAYIDYISTLPKVEAVVSLIQDFQLPDTIYDSWGMDPHDTQYRINDIRIGVVTSYGYIDILGFTSEEFEQVKEQL